MADADQPVAADTPLPQPPSRLDKVKGLIGDLARPYVLIAAGTATAKVIWAQADAGIIAAAGAFVAVLYGAKSLENYGQAKESAKVEKTRLTTVPAAPPADAGELPLDQRVRAL